VCCSDFEPVVRIIGYPKGLRCCGIVSLHPLLMMLLYSYSVGYIHYVNITVRLYNPTVVLISVMLCNSFVVGVFEFY